MLHYILLVKKNYIEEVVNTNFLGWQIDYHIKCKNHIEQC